MTYTTQQLQAMSDFQRSIAIAEKMGWEVMAHDEKLDKQIVVRKSPNERPCGFDCNNPNDIMPLAFERGLSIVQWCEGGIYTSTNNAGDFFGIIHQSTFLPSKRYRQYEDTNPLRAIACLILMIED